MSRNSIWKNCIRWHRRHVADAFKNFRRQVRRAARRPGLALGYQGFRRAIARGDWNDAHQRLPGLAQAAEAAGDAKLLTEMAFSAERLGDHAESTAWHVASARLSGPPPPDEWDGSDLSDATLLIPFMETEKQGLAVGLNMAGFVAEAAQRAAHAILVVEPRLVRIFSRTLPQIETHAFPAKPNPKPGTRLVTARPLTLKAILGSTDADIERRFLPLQTDKTESSKLRAEYQAGRDRPLIGVSWWSSHFGKDLPAVREWAELARSLDAIFVNIQYGDVAADLEILNAAAPDRLITDDSVDQLVDMDRFASQLAALDAVVTISNTGAHLAGAMGIPTCLIRDDWFRRAWPVLSDRTPWYPETRVFGKDGRAWPDVMAMAAERLRCTTPLP